MRTVVVATAAGTAGALLAGLLAIGVPAVAAGQGPGTVGRRCPGAGTGQGTGPGDGTGYPMPYGMGYGMGRGTAGGPLAGLPQGSLATGQRTALAGAAEEEKLAHDVYTVLAASSPDGPFAMLAVSEAQHLALVRALLARYGIADPTAGRADGQFASSALQAEYGDLVARGRVSPEAALAVGRDVETADLAELAAARTGVTAPDVLAVYDRLAAASRMHLAHVGGTVTAG